MDSAERRLRIGISGSYGGMNLGDEAILSGILSRLRATVAAEVTVFSQNPTDTLARHHVERAIPARTMTRREITAEINELDLLILGGGGILYDGEAQAYLREVFIALERQLPVVVYAISAGPLVTDAARHAVRDALNACGLITVRDRLAYRLLEDVGVTKEIHLTADPALLLEPEELSTDMLKTDGVEFGRNLVGFSVREPGPAAPDIDADAYYALLAQAADFIVDRYDGDVVFVPMEVSDVQHSHAVVSHMQNAERAEILRRRYSARQILDVMAHFEFAVGMRLHFLIFAARRGVPFAALPYASKVAGLLEDLDMEAPPLGRMGIGRLIATVDRSWDSRDAIRDTLARRVPGLRRRAELTNELLADGLRRSKLSSLT